MHDNDNKAVRFRNKSKIVMMFGAFHEQTASHWFWTETIGQDTDGQKYNEDFSVKEYLVLPG